MEMIIIFIICETLAAFLSFADSSTDILQDLLTFALLGGLATIILTMRLHDFLIYRATLKGKHKKAIRMYKNKFRISPNNKSRNGILLNLAPLYFMIDEKDNAIENLKKVDFLAFKKPMLKSYFQLLTAYGKYLENDFEKINDYLESAISYEPLAETVSELLKAAVLIKEDKKEEGFKLFKTLPNDLNDLDEYYFEPFDKLYLEIEKLVKN